MDAVVFDFDGVIVDSEPLHELALRGAVEAMGMTLPHERYVGEYIGYDDRDCFRVIANDHGRTLTSDELSRLADLKRREFMDAVASGRVKPYAGAPELIRAAAAAVPVAIASGARAHEIEPVLDGLGLRECFGAIVSADDVARSKPDPACYVLAASRLGVDPRRCVAIEDTDVGAASARAAGMRVVGVAHTLAASRLSTVADLVVDEVSALDVGALRALFERVPGGSGRS